MTAFGMISRFSMDEGIADRGGRLNPRAINPKRWNWNPKGPLVIQKAVPVFNSPAPIADTPALDLIPASIPMPTRFQPLDATSATKKNAGDLPPILPVETPMKPKATGVAGFFDQELIPGVKNLYLAGGAVGVVLLLVLLTRKK